ncbi:MAG: DUF3131 domain-containing protein [Gemmatimonadaceae bacterium]
MRSTHILAAISLAITGLTTFSACSKGQGSATAGSNGASAASSQAAVTAYGTQGPVTPYVASPAERELYLSAARTSWNFVNRITEPSTGLARAHATYSYVTLWDITGVIASNYIAHELGFINNATYDSHIRRILSTLSTIDLFDRSAFNRIYDAKTGRMVDNAEKLSTVGAGWSSVDLGRLLVWLRILAVKQPQYAGLATQIVRRLDMGKVLNDGYLQGVDLDPKSGKRTSFLETEIGYQQYALTGFALWGARVNQSGLDVRDNVSEVKVYGVPVLSGSRGNDRVMSEPFIMLGLETGFRSRELARQASQVLAAQAARYQQTHFVTAVTEDAMPDPPDYFYYYSVYHRGKPFIVENLDDKVFQHPRWISSKAAFGWNAILPNAYTQLVLRTVQPAGTSAGWGAGVYEGTLKPVGVPSLNTAAIILESTLYQTRGRPILAN